MWWLGLLVMIAIACWLTWRDPREDVQVFAFAWPFVAIAAVSSRAVVGVPPEAMAKLGACVLLGAIVGTWFRPGIVCAWPWHAESPGEVVRFITGWLGVGGLGFLGAEDVIAAWS